MQIAWRGIEAGTAELAVVEEDVDGLLVRSEVTAPPSEAGPGPRPGDAARHTYEVRLTADWRTRQVVVRTDVGAALELRHVAGTWYVDDVERPDLAGASDPDLEVSPLTNTLPIRRLDLAVGERAEIVTAWVARSTLEVHRDPQAYTRLSADRYLFESLDTDFRREITVDPDGFVLDYPGLFTRLTA